MKKAKILIADDEPNILKMTNILLSCDYDVLSAKDGNEALQKIISERPDLAILDVRMPQKDGLQVCKEIRNHPEAKDTPIIILSSLGEEYNIMQGFGCGASDYMTKPFNAEDLKTRIKTLLAVSK